MIFVRFLKMVLKDGVAESGAGDENLGGVEWNPTGIKEEVQQQET